MAVTLQMWNEVCNVGNGPDFATRRARYNPRVKLFCRCHRNYCEGYEMDMSQRKYRVWCWEREDIGMPEKAVATIQLRIKMTNSWNCAAVRKSGLSRNRNSRSRETKGNEFRATLNKKIDSFLLYNIHTPRISQVSNFYQVKKVVTQ